MYIHTKSTYAILKFSGSLKSRTGLEGSESSNSGVGPWLYGLRGAGAACRSLPPSL